MMEVDCVFEGLGFLTNDFKGMDPYMPRLHISRVNPFKTHEKVLTLKPGEGFYDRQELQNFISANLDITKDEWIVFNESSGEVINTRAELIDFLDKNPHTFRYVKYARYS